MASRQALYLPSLSEDGATALREIGARTATLRLLCLELEITDDVMMELGLRFGINLDDIVAKKVWDELCNDDGFVGHVRNKSAYRKAALRAYLKDIGFINVEPFGMVDLGWHGNLQVRLERCLPAEAQKPLGYYYSLFSEPEATRGRVLLFVKDVSVNGDMLETFCMATHATVQSFSFDDEGRPTVVTSKDRRDGPTRWAVAAQQEAILKYAATLFGNLDRKTYSLDDVAEHLRQAGAAAMKLFLTRPDPYEAEAYGSVVHTADQTHTIKIEMAPRLTIATLHQFATKKTTHGANVSWRHGTLMRSVPGWAYNSVTSSRMLAGKALRKLKRISRGAA